MTEPADIEENKSNNFTQQDIWKRVHTSYWNSIAGSYDSLYQSTWSEHENHDIQNRLSFLREFDVCRVLDLGAGTGLGYKICREITDIDYIGIDISATMIQIGLEKYPSATFMQGPMSDLGRFPDNSFQVVISLFGAISYEMNTYKTVKEIYRVLSNNGVAFICAMSRWSLRRLIRLKLSQIENYATRGTQQNYKVPSHVFTPSDLSRLFLQSGFNRVNIGGHGLFSGVIEYPPLWKLDQSLVRLVPHLGHLLIVTAKKYRGEKDA